MHSEGVRVSATQVTSWGLSGSVITSAYSRDLRSFIATSSDNAAEIVGEDDTDRVIEEFMEELVSLRGTPELVDRLENLVMKHPGIENNINLYRAIYPFTLDDFQEQGLQSLQSGNNVLVTTPTGVERQSWANWLSTLL